MKKQIASIAALFLFSCGSSAEPPPKEQEVKAVKTMPASASAPAALVVQPKTKPAAEKVVLIDPRDPSPKNRKVSANEREQLLSQLFTKRLKRLSQCKTRRTGAELEDDIKGGQIAPFIVASAEGSVTIPGRSQIVYLVDINECNAYEDRIGTGTSLLWVVTEESKVVAKHPIDTEDRPDILWLRDVNQDGLQDILTIDAPWGEADFIARYLRLFMLGNGAISSVDLSPKSAPRIEFNTCKDRDLKPTERSHEISIFYFEPMGEKELPVFIEEKFTKSCTKGAVFEKT